MWVKIKGFEMYSINEAGEVRNDSTGKLKKTYTNKATGYECVDLWQENKGTKKAVHRLLATAFIPNPENKPTVDHKDGNRQNNALENLRWATYSEQNSRFNTNGVRSQRIRVTHYQELRKKRGGGHERWLDADEVLYFGKISDAADYFDLTVGSISNMLKSGTIGRRGRTRGYKFEYVDGERVLINV